MSQFFEQPFGAIFKFVGVLTDTRGSRTWRALTEQRTSDVSRPKRKADGVVASPCAEEQDARRNSRSFIV